jgi:hypothetical protein
MAKAVCPKCNKVATVPDKFVGRKVVCRICETAFLVEAPAVEVTPVITAAAPPASAGVITVVARRVGQGKETMLADGTPAAPRNSCLSLAVLIVAAGLALVLPVAGAGAFVAFNLLTRGGQGAVASTQPGEYYGGIEISSRAVKATVVEMFADSKHGSDYTVRLQEQKDKEVTQGMDKTGQFDREALNETVAAVQKDFEKMTAEYPLAREKIFIVGGSGLFNAIRDNKDLDDGSKLKRIQENQAVLADAVAKATGKQIDFIDVKREVELMITGLLGTKNASRSVLIDVGNSATRGGYREQDGDYVTFEGTGVRKFENLVKGQAATPGDIPATAGRLAEKELREKLRRSMERKAGLVNREVVYLNGGIAWVMATLTHPEQREKTYVKLSAQDIEDFHALVSQNPTKFPTVNLPNGLDPDIRAKVEKDIAKMRDMFQPSWLIAGAEVLEAVSVEFQLSKKELAFTRDGGDIGWLLGYINKKAETGK